MVDKTNDIKVNQHEKLNYVEFAANDLNGTKAFFEQAFDWKFQHFGEEYIAFNNQGLDGGFYKANLSSKQDRGGALLVLFSENLESTQKKVEIAGGIINLDIFDFPGGKRFHFIEPSGNEFAVWAE